MCSPHQNRFGLCKDISVYLSNECTIEYLLPRLDNLKKEIYEINDIIYLQAKRRIEIWGNNVKVLEDFSAEIERQMRIIFFNCVLMRGYKNSKGSHNITKCLPQSLLRPL